jgi:hypothetical protein
MLTTPRLSRVGPAYAPVDTGSAPPSRAVSTSARQQRVFEMTIATTSLAAPVRSVRRQGR